MESLRIFNNNESEELLLKSSAQLIEDGVDEATHLLKNIEYKGKKYNLSITFTVIEKK